MTRPNTTPKKIKQQGEFRLDLKAFRTNGVIKLSTYMKVFKRGDIVDIKVCLNIEYNYNEYQLNFTL